MNWRAIPVSIRGTSHIKRKLPCQDFGDYKIVSDEILIGAIADGAGSAKHSDIGSMLAVETTLEYLNDYINFITKNIDNLLNYSLTEDDAKKLFCQTLHRVRFRFDQYEKLFNKTVSKKQNIQNKDLSCTLLAFIATPKWIAGMQIGDGFIVMRSSDPSIESDYQLLIPPIKGEYVNQTTFVTSKSALSELKVKIVNKPQKFIFAATDGLERIAINFSQLKPHEGFFSPFENHLKQNTLEKSDLSDWLNSQEVNSRTDDDKTILVCFYNNSS